MKSDEVDKSASDDDECARVDLSLTAYVDGELDPGHAVDVDSHVGQCSECTERVAMLRAMRASLRRSGGRHTSEALRERVMAVMASEHARRARQVTARKARASASEPVDSLREEAAEGSSVRPFAMRYAVGLAAAAGIVFAMGLSRVRPPVGDLAGRGADFTPPVPAAKAGLDDMLDDLVALHAEPLPPETKNPDDLNRFDPLVGVPVRRPAFQPFGGATFNGARVHSMRDRRAALLSYTLKNNHRVTVYVFDTHKVSVTPSRLQARVVHERDVYVGTLRGYSIAAAEKSGVGYAVASDVDGDESTELVLAAFQ